MADLLRERGERMQWYRDELLHMAKELGHRLLPAFNTTSGLPYPKVFLVSVLVSFHFHTASAEIIVPTPTRPVRTERAS